MTWDILWEWVFFLGVGSFAVMAVIVTIGGFFDLLKLFARLREEE